MTQPSAPDQVSTTAEVRAVVADALVGIAFALYVAAGVVLLGALLVFSNDHGVDFPGRYWFAIIPMCFAAATLQAQAQFIRRAGPDRRP